MSNDDPTNMELYEKKYGKNFRKDKHVTFEPILNYVALILRRQHFQQNHYIFEDSLLYPNDALLSYKKFEKPKELILRRELILILCPFPAQLSAQTSILYF